MVVWSLVLVVKELMATSFLLAWKRKSLEFGASIVLPSETCHRLSTRRP